MKPSSKFRKDRKKVEINNIIDKNILGGFILRYDGKEYNASLSNKLQKIKKELI